MDKLRILAEKIVDAASWFKRKRLIEFKGDIVKVNIGCGLAVAEGWINIDGGILAFIATCPSCIHKFVYKLTNSQKWYSRKQFCSILKNNFFVHHNLKYGLPFNDETINYIYSSHLLEHLFREDALLLLKNVRMKLKRGGIVRICVPDLEKAVSYYFKGNKEEFLSFFYSTNRKDYFGHLYM